MFPENILYLQSIQAEIAQLVEHQLPKLRVASSNLVFRSFRPLHPMDAAVSVYNGYELAH